MTIGIFPRVEVSRRKLTENYEKMIEKCRKQNIAVAGVVKGFSGLSQGIEIAEKAGCQFIASSRVLHLKRAKALGIKTPLLLIRTPMLSEIRQVVELSEYSLESEIEVLKALDKEAGTQGKTHKVILMSDLGDLREGFFNKDELMKAALIVENNLKNLELAGVGTNLGCYGAIVPTTEKLKELVQDAENIEAKIGRKLEYISGGATSSIIRILEGNMPARINMLRIGEGIIAGRSGNDVFDFMHQDVFTARAEVIEVKDKASYPIGEIGCDAFGYVPEYQDRGVRKRAIVALGKVDYALIDKLYPRQQGITIMGASSDHTILDIEDCDRDIKVGDVLDFDLCYGSMVYITGAETVEKLFIK